MTLFASFVTHPRLALLPAVALGLLAAWRRQRFAWIAAIAWVLYAAYETAMAMRILCTGACNIRIDLFLLHPLLLVMTLVAVVAVFRARHAR